MADISLSHPTQTIQVTDTGAVIDLSNPASDIALVATGGPQGPRGESGPAGADSDKNFEQAFVGDSVTVTHNLNKYPAVSVFTSAGDEVEGDVQYLSTNQVQVFFGASFSGNVICN